jgi:hypothetical protein
VPPTETPTPPPDTPTPEPEPVEPTEAPVEPPQVEPTEPSVEPPARGTVPLDDTAFTGGFSSPSVWKGRTARWVYSQRTEYSRMQAEFDLEGEPDDGGEATLTLFGMDSENPPRTLTRIEINGATIFENPNPLPDDTNDLEDNGNWGSATITFPASVLQQGSNTIAITNLENTGGFSLPPFFMLDRLTISY